MKGNFSLIMLRLGSIVLQLVYIKIYTNFLTAEELGRFFYLIALSYSANALVFIPLDYYQQAKLIAFYDKPVPIKAFLGLNAKAALIALIFVTVVGSIFWHYSKIEMHEIPQVLLYSALLHVCTASRNLLNNLHRRLFVVVALILEALLRGGLFAGSQLFRPPTAETLFQTAIIAYAIEALIIGYYFKKNVPISQDSTYRLSMRDAAIASYPVSFSAVCNWIQIQAYRLVYVGLGFASIAGIYATVANVGSVGMNALAQIASQILTPRLYRSQGTYLLKYLTIAVGLVFTAIVGYAVLGQLVLKILTRETLAAYWPILLFGASVEGLNFLIGIITTYLTINQKATQLVTANLLGVVAVLVSFYAVYLYDLSNVYLIGIPLLVSQLVVCLHLFYLTQINNR
ncbi:hypothetical protein [Pigmentiphaga litoralis]|uniref:O-antigen/teichoic acid export membrane protein n=1 Tax=Pigmentiphaga litoralis TaxID=516702 RepID=A0A7Y9ITF2_9BURK|nr:hypothetical protein [Pigmentiphaga litoralis]NYE24223.1 O-antigen/teichoic acid export membrane protein [Pigmentiphaga litoralis]NYE82163.1 O-antigen/teichoic acid export membrane protein [Pigmentiphaga litoralis]